MPRSVRGGSPAAAAAGGGGIGGSGGGDGGGSAQVNEIRILNPMASTLSEDSEMDTNNPARPTADYNETKHKNHSYS